MRAILRKGAVICHLSSGWLTVQDEWKRQIFRVYSVGPEGDIILALESVQRRSETSPLMIPARFALKKKASSFRLAGLPPSRLATCSSPQCRCVLYNYVLDVPSRMLLVVTGDW